MKDIVEEYEGDVERNLDNIKDILENEIKVDESDEILNIMKENLEGVSSAIVKRWESGKKYVRTKFVKENLKDYPKDILNASVSLDAEINLLDDLLDEELDKNDRAINVVGILRSLSLLNHKNLNEKTREAVSRYFEKLLCVAVLEKTYREKIENTDDYDEILSLSEEIYRCRSLDIDIFVQIPLMNGYKNLSKEERENVLERARLFRGLNLLKKDINDIEHDKKTEIPNVLISIEKKGIDLKKFRKDLTDFFISKLNETESKIDTFKESGKEEVRQINKLEL